MNALMFLSCLLKSELQTSVTDFKHKSYPNYLRQTVIAIFTLSLVACGGGSETAVVATPPVSDVTPAPIPDVPQERAVILPGDECATGGIEVSSGGTTEIICDGKDGLDGITALVSQTVIGPGDSCDNGGLRFDVGLDINDNGTLETAEVDSTEFLCTVVVDTAGFEAPSVVSAISISNTEILLQFSEPMTISDIENFNNYSVTTVDTKTQVPVWDAVIANQDNSTVLLSTLSQSSVSYLVTATNVRDVDGNAITKPSIADSTILSNPSTTSFVGTDPSGNAIADSDGDTLEDHTELSGWDITITYGNGTTESRRVTSDPGDPQQPVDSAVNIAAKDTDNDGVTDNEERHGGMDPRRADTDGDILTDNQEWNIIYSNPSHQDSDGDGTEDGFEFYSYRTSPVLADTDGDQISDTDEVLERNRDPRIADLPLYSIDVGNLRLQIDERFTYEDVDGQTVVNESSSNVTMSFGTSSSSIEGDSQYLQGILDLQGGIQEGNVQKLVQTNWTIGGSQSVSDEDSAESQRVREESVNKGSEFSTTNTVTREIVGARIDAGISIENRGDLAFTITNLEVTVLQRSRASTRRFIPVATLIANSTLISGEPATFNLGPFTTERGPILFSSRDIFPNLVDELMQLPPGALVFEVANFDVVDELGRQFTFANQTARDKTASVIIDTGDANIKRHLVATALQPDPDGFSGLPGEFVGGFNGDGSPKGISLDFALQDILGLTKNANEQDGIVAGVDQTADSIASGDDVQLIPPGTTGVSVGSIVISAGQDGILESVVSLNDEAEVTTGYETSRTCNVSSENAGQLCGIDSQCSGATAECSGPEVLVRFGSQRNGDFGRQWVLLTTETVRAGADFGRITLKPREDIYLAFVQDLDQDGIFAREEFLSGSTDSSADVYDNSSFGDGEFEAYDLAFDQEGELVGFTIPTPVAEPDGIPDSKDTDRDGLGDFAEIRVGWKVSADGGLLQQVYPSPRLADSDGDGMLDPQEQDLSPFCFEDANGVGDPRQDALCRYQLEDTVNQDSAISIMAGSNGIADSLAVGDDEQRVLQMTSSLTSNTVVIGPGANGVIDTVLSGDDQYESSQSSSRITPSSNPLLADTDVDGVGDFAELNGYLVGTSIRDGNIGNGDDFLQVNEVDQQVNCGADGYVDTLLKGDDYYTYSFTFGIEHSYGSRCERTGSDGTTNPVIFSGRNSVIDSIPNELPSKTRDGSIADSLAVGDDIQQAYFFGEVFAGGIVILPGLNGTIESTAQGDDFYEPGLVVTTDPLRRDTDSDLVADGRERDQGGDPTDALDGEQFRDSDQDGLSDSEESVLGWVIYPNGFGARLVLSNPSVPDSDFDGLPDLAERILGTDPNSSDTDSDGLSDFDEVADFERFFGLDEQYPGFFVDGANSMQYGSSPTLSDTDGDYIGDYTELVVGYRLVVPGESVPRQIFTNPLTWDTDGDGVHDRDEYDDPSDATVIDTDGDGRSDLVERLANTNPLVPDVAVSINAERIIIDKITDSGGNEGGEFLWFITTQKSGSNPELLSSARIYADAKGWDANNLNIIGTPFSLGNLIGGTPNCHMIADVPEGTNETSTLVLNNTKLYTLKEGDTVIVRGILAEGDAASPDCGDAPNYIPSNITGGCTSSFSQTFRYEDFKDGGQGTFPFPDGAGTAEGCDWTLEINAEGK
ncbi:MAG: hypothetical protein ACI936_000897 [Paraglaciecola sp.]|jgi:hypothetical protein